MTPSTVAKLEARSYATCCAYTSLKILTLLVQTVGLILAYLLGIFYNYQRLAITGCPVSSPDDMLGKGRQIIRQGADPKGGGG